MTTNPIPASETATPPEIAAEDAADRAAEAAAARAALLPRTGLVLAGILMAGANLRVGITTVGPVLEDIRVDQGMTAAVASIMISIPLVAFAVMSPVAPLIAARLGVERTLAAALAVLSAAIVMRSLPVEGFIWIGTALLGIAVAVLNVVLPSLVKRDFPDRVGQITGWYSAVQGLVAATAAGIAVPVAGMSEGGWRIALGMWAALALIALAVFWPQLRRRALPAGAAAAPAAARRSPAARDYRSPWGSALAWQVTLFMGLQSTVFFVTVTWLPSIERSVGVDAATAGFHQFLLQVSGVVGNIAASMIIQRFRSQSGLAVAATLLSAVGILGMLLAPELGAIWAIVIGLSCGTTIVTALSIFGLRSVNHRQAASLSGMAQSLGYALAAAGPIVIGLLHDATGSWRVPLLIMLGLLAVQLVTGALAGRDRRILPSAR